MRSGLLGTLRGGVGPEASLEGSPAVQTFSIIGGGIAGLLAGYHFKKAGHRVTVLEAGSRAGGLIDTTETEWGLVEHAAHSYVNAPALDELARDLGLGLEFLNHEHRARYIYRGGQLRRFPLSLLEALEVGARIFTLRQRPGLTVSEWGDRYLGRSGKRFLLEPMVAGIYCGDPTSMSFSAAFPTLEVSQGHRLPFYFMGARRAPQNGQLPKERRGVFAIQGGSAALVRALERYLGDDLKLGRRVDGLSAIYQSATNVVLATPAVEAARLLGTLQTTPPYSRLATQATASAPVGQTSQRASLFQEIAAIEYVPLVTVTVFVERLKLSRFQEGIGVLIPRGEFQDNAIRGVLFNSSAFGGRVKDNKLISLTVMLGGAQYPECMALDDAAIQSRVIVALRELLGLQGELSAIYITRWPRALPHYTPTLEALWPRLHQALAEHYPGLLLFGNYTGQVSVRGMAASCRSSKGELHT